MGSGDSNPPHNRGCLNHKRTLPHLYLIYCAVYMQMAKRTRRHLLTAILHLILAPIVIHRQSTHLITFSFSASAYIQWIGSQQRKKIDWSALASPSTYPPDWVIQWVIFLAIVSTELCELVRLSWWSSFGKKSFAPKKLRLDLFSSWKVHVAEMHQNCWSRQQTTNSQRSWYLCMLCFKCG